MVLSPAARTGRPAALLAIAGLALTLGACLPGPHISAPFREGPGFTSQDRAAVAAYRHLASDQGPQRFALVAPGVYRGGQPSQLDLQKLRALGVTTVINLRREDGAVWRRERAWAKELGMRFQHFPFYGVFAVENRLLEQILGEVQKGQVYVHCLNGRDRTSLVVALYRVQVERWDPEVAWKREALEYGHRQTFYYGGVRRAFRRMAAWLIGQRR